MTGSADEMAHDLSPAFHPPSTKSLSGLVSGEPKIGEGSPAAQPLGFGRLGQTDLTGALYPVLYK